ncbi:MAG: M24 family metallopeptidase [Verrucomicrobiota bacterium]
MHANKTILLAGVTTSNNALYHRFPILLPDIAAFIGLSGGDSVAFVRDIEMARAEKSGLAGRICSASEYPPEGGLDGDRDTAMAQAVAEFLRRETDGTIHTDRTLPFIFAHHIREAGLELCYDPELGVLNRRTKSEREFEALRHAQTVTQQAMIMACETIGRATSDAEGILHHDGEVLTSERVRRMITRFLIDEGFSNPNDSIVVTLPHVVDCHHFGTGPLKTGLPVIVDIFPRDDTSRYCGDCTRTVVHGEPSDELVAMHKAVVAAKQAGVDALKPGETGHAVHQHVLDVIKNHGYAYRPGSCDLEDPAPAMRHGTGHGIGLDVHEPILLSEGGGEILLHEVFTVEPGLYSSRYGGVRVEDMVIVIEDGGEVIAGFHEGLEWG